MAGNFFLRKRETQSLSGKPILIGKTKPYWENQLLIGKTNPYRENQSLSGKQILIGKTNLYRENKSLSGKPIFIGKTNPYQENQQQTFYFVCLFIIFVKTFFRRSTEEPVRSGREETNG